MTPKGMKVLFSFDLLLHIDIEQNHAHLRWVFEEQISGIISEGTACDCHQKSGVSLFCFAFSEDCAPTAL
jgi:hypothetical protein